jgi:single-strand DNA-binding protein
MLNEAKIIGHLGRDPETKTLPSGDAVTNFSIATTEKWKDKTTGEAKEATEWHRISMFGKLAEIAAKYLHKGSLVYVSGKLVTRKYNDANGVEKYSTEIKADTMKMLGGKADALPADAPAPAARPAAADDDIPF